MDAQSGHGPSGMSWPDRRARMRDPDDAGPTSLHTNLAIGLLGAAIAVVLLAAADLYRRRLKGQPAQSTGGGSDAANAFWAQGQVALIDEDDSPMHSPRIVWRVRL